MLSNRLAFAALAVACIGAAAGGSYLATRRNAVPEAPVASAQPAVISSAVRAAAEGETSTNDVGSSLVPLASSATANTTSAAPATKRAEPARTVQSEAPRASLRVKQSAPSGSRRSAEPASAIERSPSAASAPPSTPSTPPPAVAATPAIDPSPQAPPADERAGQENPVAEPPQKVFEELVVAADSVIGLQAETPISSDRARVEDRVEARVTRDVRVRDMVAIPAGTRAIGSVTLVERGGKFKERARLGIRFHTLMLADGTRMPISTETIYREGEPPGNETAKKVGGGAIAGTILGAIIGGGKGAAIGATAGAAAGAGTVMAGDRHAATLRPGEPITVRMLSPVVITLEK